MRTAYRVESEYRRGNQVALFLDHDIPFNAHSPMVFQPDGIAYPYELTYTESIITTESECSFLEKTIYLE